VIDAEWLETLAPEPSGPGKVHHRGSSGLVNWRARRLRIQNNSFSCPTHPGNCDEKVQEKAKEEKHFAVFDFKFQLQRDYNLYYSGRANTCRQCLQLSKNLYIMV